MQYAVAVTLLNGRLTADDYEDAAAADPRIERLRLRMQLTEEPRFTDAYRDPARRANMNAIEVVFKDGSRAGPVEVEFPIGHPRRRAEGIPLLITKFETNLARRYAERKRSEILAACLDHRRLLDMPVSEFTDLFVPADAPINRATSRPH